MKIWELDWTEGQQYKISHNGFIYTVKNGDLISLGCDITEVYPMRIIMTIEFEPYTDWSKVKVDTKIFVRDDENEAWSKRYFAKYENGNVFTFWFGFTSWTHPWVRPLTDWKYAKLAESGDVDE